MPCDESSGRIHVWIDGENRLIRFDYRKITCGKTIGGSTGYGEYCAGRSIDEILRLSFSEVLRVLPAREEDDPFLLHMEWDALSTALRAYLGREIEGNAARYQVASIVADEDGGAEIRLVIAPPEEMPPVRPCSSSHRKGVSE